MLAWQPHPYPRFIRAWKGSTEAVGKQRGRPQLLPHHSCILNKSAAAQLIMLFEVALLVVSCVVKQRGRPELPPTPQLHL
jgi:hypothetical protein